MADRPIAFSTPMVQALLREIAKPGTGKTQTRRMIQPQPERTGNGNWHIHNRHGGSVLATALEGPEELAEVAATQLTYLSPPWEPGDRAWVREGLKRVVVKGMPVVSYAADATELIDEGLHSGWAWKPSALAGRYMPRWANRITLHITDVRVHRLQDITPDDCRAEGHPMAPKNLYPQEVHDDAARDWYMDLWGDLHGGPESWRSNPWVYALTFVPELAHIDNARSAP